MAFSDEILIKQLNEIAASLARIEQLLASNPKAEIPGVNTTAMQDYPYTYCDDKIASELTGLSRHWFQRMRWAGGGPPYSKLGGGRGGSVRYKVEDLRAWFDGK